MIDVLNAILYGDHLPKWMALNEEVPISKRYAAKTSAYGKNLSKIKVVGCCFKDRILWFVGKTKKKGVSELCNPGDKHTSMRFDTWGWKPSTSDWSPKYERKQWYLELPKQTQKNGNQNNGNKKEKVEQTTVDLRSVRRVIDQPISFSLNPIKKRKR